MSDAVGPSGEAPQGTSLLPADLSERQLDAAPVLRSVDSLLIDDLTEHEDDAFAAALEPGARSGHGADPVDPVGG